jgi:zinc protease
MRYIVTFLLCLLVSFPALAVTEVQEIKTKKGFTIWLIEEHTLPLVSARIGFKNAGFAHDPKEKEGLATLATELLNEGTLKQDRKTFKTTLENHAIYLSFSSDIDHVFANMETLKEHYLKAFELMSEALTQPLFKQEAMDRKHQQMVVALSKEQESPQSTASRKWQEGIFKDHPYSQNPLGNETSLKNITRADLQQFAKRNITRENIVISIVGDITPEEAESAVDRYFDILPQTEATHHSVPWVSKYTADATTEIFKEAPQTTIAFGAKGVHYSDPDFYTAYVLNYILGGGGFESRLMEEVRDERGLAYSIYTYLTSYEGAALLKGNVATRNGKVDDTIAVIKEVFEGLQKEGITKNDLALAKKYLIGSFHLKLDTNSNLSHFLTYMQLRDLGIDFLEKRNSLIEKVTLEEVNRVAKTLLDPQRLFIVTVGGNKKTQE